MGELQTLFIGIISKCCTRCNETKYVTEFHRSSKSKDGYQSYCKSCMSEKQKEWRNANREQARINWRRGYYNNQEKRMEYQRKLSRSVRNCL